MSNRLILLLSVCLLWFSSYSQDGPNADAEVTIRIYPNPAVEFLMIRIYGDVSNAEFELNSMIGNKLQIRPEEMGAGVYQIQVKDLAAGYYFLVVKDEKKRFKRRLNF